ncbi:MAG: T9SS type A sorting domain-containing protein [Bacteroidia bacterium]|nr:T9SS type A sorting domain-containing protein [Bacteroidia bacterium]
MGTFLSAQSTFQLSLGDAATDNAYEVVENLRGNYWVAGSEKSNQVLENGVLFEINSLTAEVIRKIYVGNPNSETRFYDLFELPDSSLFLLGCAPCTGNSTNGFLTRLSPDGNDLGHWTFDANPSDNLSSITPLGHQRYLLSGFSSGGNYDFCAVKTNLQGNTIWRRQYGTPTGFETNNGMNVSAPAGKGGAVLGGFSIVGSAYNMLICRIDSNGTLLWSMKYGGGTGSVTQAVAIAATQDGFLMTGGINFGGNVDLFLTKTDTAGNQLWTKIYSSPGTDFGWDVAVQANGEILLTGTLAQGAGGSDLLLMRCDFQGNILKAKTFGGNQEDIGYCVVPTSDQGVLAVGRTSSFSSSNFDKNIYLVKTDSSLGSSCPENTPSFTVIDTLLNAAVATLVTSNLGSLSPTTETVSPSPITDSLVCRQIGCEVPVQLSLSQGPFCPGDTLSLTHGATFADSAFWYHNGNLAGTHSTQKIALPANGSQIHLDLWWDGCLRQLDTLITPEPQPQAAFSYSQSSGTEIQFTDLSQGSVAAWNWNFAQLDSSSQQNPDYEFPGTGNWAVCLTVTSQSGCSDTLCDTVEVLVGREEGYEQGLIHIYPIPAQTSFFVELSQPFTIQKAILHDLSGSAVLNLGKSSGSNQQHYFTLQKSISPGIYLLELQTEGNTFFRKLVVQ